ncbi:MAG: DUF3857 and transglutaminase domain-containing protein [Bacteroidales bacterium]|jgi:transglutaminase-like putative cysteine protease|nr:DUF3857 and transglutaminase domain-containing protein [Bacteroidales bacterium]
MNRRKIILAIGLLITFLNPGRSGELFYKVSDIPAGLRENARSVIRQETRELTVTDINKATLKVSVAITVLNKNGLADANFEEYYDRYRSVSSIKGRVYNESGELIRKIAGDEIEDLSAISGYSVYEDNRLKYIDPGIRQVPFTVEYYYEVVYHGIIGYPSWSPVHDHNISVEKSTFKASVAKNLEFRYRESNLPVKGSVTSDDQCNIYQWELLNQEALKREPLSPARRDYFPLVMMAPSDFEIGGYKGNSDTWTNFGDWIFTLNEGRDVLPVETVAEMNDMVKNCLDEHEKISLVYQYMQNRVRYVNLEIGMGGWQPIDAATVQRLAYGDCKALTNYMKALLKAIGIHSYYCLVGAGESAPDVIPDFPSTQFNHVILCVPVHNDTTWLECTSQRLPCGYLGGFTENRHALLIDRSASMLVWTNRQQPGKNLEMCRALIKFDDSGNGSVNMVTTYGGLSYDEILPAYLADDTDKKKMISERMTFPSFQVLDFSYKEERDRDPSIEESIGVSFENYLVSINSRFLMPVNCTNRLTYSPGNSRNRKTDVVIRNSFREIDSLVFEVPANLKVESIPAPVDITSPFGSYRSSVILADHNLIYLRTLQISKGVHPASSYADLVDFFDKMTMADDEKCVFVRKE